MDEDSYSYDIFNTHIEVNSSATVIKSKYSELIFPATLAYNYQILYEMLGITCSYKFNNHIKKSDLFSVIRSYLLNQTNEIVIEITAEMGGHYRNLILPEVNNKRDLNPLKFHYKN
jgi:hypothetical protein